jgi:predicted nucleic acid-binding protein
MFSSTSSVKTTSVHPKAEALIVSGGVVSVQVLNQLASVSRRKLGLSWEEIGDAIAAIRVLCPSPTPLTIDTHDAGLRLAAQYGFLFYDALIVAAALEADCTTFILRGLPEWSND